MGFHSKIKTLAWSPPFSQVQLCILQTILSIKTTVQHCCTGSRNTNSSPPLERSTCGVAFQASSWAWTLLPQEEGCTAKPESEPCGHGLYRQLSPWCCERHQPHGPRPVADCGHPADSTGSLRYVRVVHGPSGNRQHSGPFSKPKLGSRCFKSSEAGLMNQP